MNCELCERQPRTKGKLCTTCAEGVHRLNYIMQDMRRTHELELEFTWARERYLDSIKTAEAAKEKEASAKEPEGK